MPDDDPTAPRRSAMRIFVTIAAVVLVALTAVCAALLVEIRNDMDAATDAVLLQDGVIADGIWVAVHSEQRPVLRDGKIHHSAPAAPVAAGAEPSPATTTTTTTERPAATTTKPPTTTAAATSPPTTQATQIVIEDFYLASDGETYFVEVSGVLGSTYCEAHLVGSDGRRTGEWTNELLTGGQDSVTLSLWDYDRVGRADAVEVECSG